MDKLFNLPYRVVDPYTLSLSINIIISRKDNSVLEIANLLMKTREL